MSMIVYTVCAPNRDLYKPVTPTTSNLNYQQGGGI